MPEGHTLHRYAREHRAWFAGAVVAVSSPQGRFPGAAVVDGTVLEDVEAYGKHLFYRFEAQRHVHVHLGLFGRFFGHERDHAADWPPAVRATVRMRIATDSRAIDLVGATACELLTPDERAAIEQRLGPDPLRDDTGGADDVLAALRRRRIGIGRALMDQQVLAGVGNVYRAEVLFVHGVHPEVPAAEVDATTVRSMWETLRTWMRHGVRTGRIVTTDPEEIGKPRHRMSRTESRYVYKQDRCLRCAAHVRRYDLAGRWAYVCEACQPPPETARA